MGAWGAGAFENDEALDLLADLEAALPDGRGPRVRAALTLPDGALDRDAANAAVAAAALVAAAAGMPVERPDVAELAASGSLPVDPATRSLASAAIARIGTQHPDPQRRPTRSSLAELTSWLADPP